MAAALPPADKIIVINRGALTAKYGASGLATVQAALARLIRADAARGLTTSIVAIDDAAAMAKLGGHAVGGPADERGAKAAVDAIFSAHAPDYLLLLDGPDVVPHIALQPIRGLSDLDLTIPSDLPYASPAGWSRRAASFLAVTRVVGRLPAAVVASHAGSADPAGIVSVIGAACAHAPRPSSAFNPPFALSAAIWQSSTQSSVNTVFGPGTGIDLAPPATHPVIDPALPRLGHFINCHGATASDLFYGEAHGATPIAMSSALIAPHVAGGTVVTAECCYGAELYDPVLFGIAPPICMTYLQNGAAAFLGSTTIAYGPAVGNGQADLLTQYFFNHVLAGASTGRALLQARQDFIRTQPMSSPANLKTLAQFLLLGDPSCRPCQLSSDEAPTAQQKAVEQASADSASAPDIALARKACRVALEGAGKAAASTATRPGAFGALPPALIEQIHGLARQRAMATRATTVLEVTGGAIFRSAMKSREGDRKVVTVVCQDTDSRSAPWPCIRLLTAHILDGRIIRIEEAERR